VHSTQVNGVTRREETRLHAQQVSHTQGPWDGSLYAQVNKQQQQQLLHQQQQQQQQQLLQQQQQRTVRAADHFDGVTGNGLMHNGPSHLPNGSITSSIDSGVVKLPTYLDLDYWPSSSRFCTLQFAAYE
jgi:hypothetical protein